MARIRTIKPEFPQSETIGSLSRDARLLFIQLWTIADDHGRAKAAPRLLASLLYPYDDDATKLMPKWLAELERAGCIRLYQVDGKSYLDIPNWRKHQRVDNAGKSQIPEYVAEVRREPPRDSEGDGEPPRDSESDGEPPLDLGPRTIGPRTIIRAVAEATRPANDEFEEIWQAYPKRKGANPKAPAKAAYDAAVKAGAKPSHMLAALKAGVGFDPDKIGTEFIPQAQVWFRQKRWQDYLDGTEADNARRASSTGPPAHLTGKERADWVHEQLRKQRELERQAAHANGGTGNVLDEGAGVCSDEQPRPEGSPVV